MMDKKFEYKKFPVSLEIVLGVFVLVTCWLVHNHIEMKVAEARQITCTQGSCTLTTKFSKSSLKDQICDLKKLSDATFQECLDSKEKFPCYQTVHQLDKEVVEKEGNYWKLFKEYPICE